MKNLSATWNFCQILLYSAIALSSILLIIYGIYQFAVTFLPALLETANPLSTL